MGPTAFGDLTGRKTVVTGSSTGIGAAIALEFARAGADVIVHCNRSLAEAQDVAAEIHSMGRAAHVLSADLGGAESLEPFIESAWNCFQGIDIWVNNAGVDLLTGEDARLEFAAKLQRLLDVDVRASILLSRVVGQRMWEAGHGVILNIGWDQADRGMEGYSGELFAASKNSVMGFTRSLAVTLGPQVRANCIAPGWIQTEWGETAGDYWQQRVLQETPLKRWGTPDDVAKLARFLASSDADFMTGQIIRVNGGAIR